LAKRLVRLHNKFKEEQKDVRFFPLIENFIKYTIGNLLNEYNKLQNVDKKESHKIIRKSINSDLKSYISIIKYYKIKLGLL
jgi:hypothetical protein